MSPAGTRCHHSSGCWAVAAALCCQDPAQSAAAVISATPSRLCVPFRCPPLSRCTIQAKAPVRKPNVRAMVDPGSSRSGRIPAPLTRARGIPGEPRRQGSASN
jgi:hypothetical protein